MGVLFIRIQSTIDSNCNLEYTSGHKILMHYNQQHKPIPNIDNDNEINEILKMRPIHVHTIKYYKLKH